MTVSHVAYTSVSSLSGLVARQVCARTSILAPTAPSMHCRSALLPLWCLFRLYWYLGNLLHSSSTDAHETACSRLPDNRICDKYSLVCTQSRFRIKSPHPPIAVSSSLAAPIQLLPDLPRTLPDETFQLLEPHPHQSP